MEKFLRSNNFARGLAIFLALALWLFVTGDNITQITPAVKVYRDVPLRQVNLQEGLVVVDMPASVDVTLEGIPEAFEGLSVTEVDVFVDLSELGTGSHLLPVSGKSPRGLDLLLIEPNQVKVVIEPLQSAAFTVQPEFFGTPAAGWSVKSHACEPPLVTLEAAQSILAQVDRVVLPVNLDGRKELIQDELVPLVLDRAGEEITGITVIPATVEVFVRLESDEGQA